MNRTAIALALLLASCATPHRGGPPELNAPPAVHELEAAEYGAPPLPEHEATIRAAIARTLLDPESARFAFAEPEPGWAHQYVIDGPPGPYQPGHAFGWRVAVEVNARNAFGGYTGAQRYDAFFQDGQIRAILRPADYLDVFGFARWDAVLIWSR